MAAGTTQVPPPRELLMTLNPEFNEVGWPERRQSRLLGEGSASCLTVQAPATLGHLPESVPEAVKD